MSSILLSASGSNIDTYVEQAIRLVNNYTLMYLCSKILPCFESVTLKQFSLRQCQYPEIFQVYVA